MHLFRTWWVRSIFKERKLKGEFHALIQDLKLFGSEYFLKQFRMTSSKLEELLSWIAPKTEMLSVRRKPIDPEQRLCVTLRYLVTGDAHVAIAGSYRISPTSISTILKKTTCAIWDVLLEKGYLQPPQSSKDWENISRGFKNRGNFLHCADALDGKDVAIQAPAKSESFYFIYLFIYLFKSLFTVGIQQ